MLSPIPKVVQKESIIYYHMQVSDFTVQWTDNEMKNKEAKSAEINPNEERYLKFKLCALKRS